MDDADVKEEGFGTKGNAEVATAIIVPMVLAGLDPRTPSGFGGKVSKDIDNIVVADDGEVACFVNEAVPRVKVEVDSAMAVVRGVWGEGEVEAEFCGGGMGLGVHRGGWERVTEVGAGERSAAGKEVGTVDGREFGERSEVCGIFSRTSEPALKFFSSAGVGEVEGEALVGGGVGGWEVSLGDGGGDAG